MYSVYFAKSLRNQKVYVGFTSINPEERVKQHNSSSNEFTKHNGPFRLVYHEDYFCKEDAMNRERFYKMGFGKHIKQIIVKYTEEKVLRL